MNIQEKTKVKELIAYSKKLHIHLDFIKSYPSDSVEYKNKLNLYSGIVSGIDYVLKELGCVLVEKE